MSETQDNAVSERDDILTPSMDNVLAWRLGEAFGRTAKATAGDYIDRGLALRHELQESGFGIVKLSPDHLFIGQHPRTPTASADVVEAVAELQLAAFLAGRGSVTSMRHGTRSAKPSPSMDEFRNMARAALRSTP